MLYHPDVIHDASPEPSVAPPPDFDARRYPIIGQHFYGLVVYPRSNDVVATDKAAA